MTPVTPLLGFVLALALMIPGADPDPEGYWLTEDENAVLRIQLCDEGICGSLYWMEEGDDLVDQENRDRSLRDRPLCGLQILGGFEQDEDDPAEWRDGEVYAPDDGRTWSARVRVTGPDELDLRGYRGISLLGRTQTWTRVDPDDYPACEAAGGSTGRSTVNVLP
ncbi:MAG: DUF2147 domain-containing protein [Gemmatimonadales bacterium]|nr:MAG: DUF2147 domain-containing protein [Gemmatimonadales bacterium]